MIPDLELVIPWVACSAALIAAILGEVRRARSTRSVLRAYAEKLTALEGELQATLKTRAEFESLRDRLKKAIEVADELSHSLKKQTPPLFPPPPNTHSFDLIAMNAAEVGDFPQDFFLGSEPEPLSVRLIDKKKDPIH